MLSSVVASLQHAALYLSGTARVAAWAILWMGSIVGSPHDPSGWVVHFSAFWVPFKIKLSGGSWFGEMCSNLCVFCSSGSFQEPLDGG